MFAHARVHAELKLMDYSAESLGEAAEGTGTPEERKKRREDRERWLELGAPIKRDIRESLFYSLMPEHLQAMHKTLYGRPGETETREVKPLQGVSREVAAAIVADIKAKTFSGVEWGGHALWEQLEADGGLAQMRLEATAKGTNRP